MALFKRVKIKSIFLNKFLKYNIFFRIWTLEATIKEVKYFKEPRGWKSVCKNKAILTTQLGIYDGAFCINSLRLSAIFAKGFVKDVRLGSKYTSEKTETFKMKLWLAKSSRLLQSAVFLVLLYSINWPHFIVWLPLLREILGDICMISAC